MVASSDPRRIEMCQKMDMSGMCRKGNRNCLFWSPVTKLLWSALQDLRNFPSAGEGEQLGRPPQIFIYILWR